ncbi:hypothetical protein [Niveispirillum sp.]|uniref:hypothetical protein n=1 Tax=Niveispirillum sp. TaxID=1917217 RepID=UPI001B7C179F|nr:hypothetical protein [Niveispirillum sp.]MBP7338933.1 hypothetical protein [Niveispirillum sp.]
MISFAPSRQWLIHSVVAVILLAALWSASILVEGFSLWGNMDGAHNPLGHVAVPVAAAAITSATACIFLVLGFQTRIPRPLLEGIFAALLLLAAPLPLMKTYAANDAFWGDWFVSTRAQDPEIMRAWAQRLDQDMTDHYRELVQAADRGDTLRAAYDRALTHVKPLDGPERASIPLPEIIAALRSKAGVLNRFAEDAGVHVPDFAEQTDVLEMYFNHWVEEVSQGRSGFIHRQSLAAWGAMLSSLGQANPGFTLNVLLSLLPFLIQAVCALLLRLLRSPAPVPAVFPTKPDVQAAGWNHPPTKTIH